jgi:hypothetical protein
MNSSCPSTHALSCTDAIQILGRSFRVGQDQVGLDSSVLYPIDLILPKVAGQE